MAKPNSKAPVGQGGRFAALEHKLAQKPGVTNPGALAAAVGRAKYGSGKFARMAAKGKKRKKDNPKDSPAVEAAERASGIAT